MRQTVDRFSTINFNVTAANSLDTVEAYHQMLFHKVYHPLPLFIPMAPTVQYRNSWHST